MIIVIALLLFWIPLSFLTIWMGGKREIGSKTSFWITTFLGPVIGLIAVALSKKREAKQIDYYAELLKFSALKDKGLISESEFNGEKQKLDYAKNNVEELKPDNTGIYYYIIALLIVLTICAINLIAVYRLYNENEAKKELIDRRNSSRTTNAIRDNQIDVVKTISEENFNDFFHKFNADSLFQIKRIKFPLNITVLDENYEKVNSKLEINNSRHLNLEYRNEYAKRGIDAYTQEIKIRGDSAMVQIRGVNNGMYTDFEFIKAKGQWFLVSETDLSN